MDVNIATDVKGANVSVLPTNVELEDAAKPPVQPVPASSENDTVKLNNQTRQDKSAKEDASSQGKLSQKELEDAVKEIHQRFQSMGSNFKFGLYEHQETKSIVAQLRDKKTDEVVKQFPSEEVLKLREKLQDLIGMLFDEKV
ncbi:MAG: flagellar protein FlaG [Proteobacteria bacterium]|nr:flagellar protein FlaG [Pseudomonadota bacterium]MBU4296708.1 flagellar protein FlaG [Pseudomonadota bacterium]MCG2748501.1 flagellar protein FlaG [Desulfobulbaceae bacterium]